MVTQKTKHHIFSLGGFTQGLKELGKPNTELVTLEQMYT